MTQPQIIKQSLFAIQACVPAEWDDEKIVEWAGNVPPSPPNRYTIRKPPIPPVAGQSYQWNTPAHQEPELERVPCEKHQGMIHLILEC